MKAPMEKMISKWRKEMLKRASGKTLEVGIGTGKNIPLYPENIQLTGIDFSPKMEKWPGEKLNDTMMQGGMMHGGMMQNRGNMMNQGQSNMMQNRNNNLKERSRL